jgi:hypothetical protein
MKKKTYTLDVIACPNCIGRIKRRGEIYGEGWDEGTVVTPHGIVEIDANEYYTKFDFAYKGKLYIKKHNKWLKPASITRIAKDFASKVVGKKLDLKKIPASSSTKGRVSIKKLA